jgi:hypothetical protein
MLKHMHAKGAASVTPQLRPEDADMPLLSWIDPEDFNPSYIQRSIHLLPKRGPKRDWQHTQDYWREKDEFPIINLDGAEFAYATDKTAAIAAE